jgi:hypothetical protein
MESLNSYSTLNTTARCGLKFSPETGYLHEKVRCFPQSLQANTGTIPYIGHLFFRYPSQLVIHNHPTIRHYTERFITFLAGYGSALHGVRCTAGCEVHKNFADDSVCLMADVWNEGKLLTLWTACQHYVSRRAVRKFVYDLSAVGGSYQLHLPFVLSYN